MDGQKLSVLAVADPAVMVYADQEKDILKGFPGEVELNIVPWDSYYNTMLEMFKGQSDIDVFMVAGHLWKRDFIEKGYLAEIEMEQEDILPVIAKEMKYQGKNYLSPCFCDGHMIVYRKSIIKKVTGQELSEIITPQEYLEVAEKLSQHGYKTAMKADRAEVFTDALPFMRMYGSDVYDQATGEIMCHKKEIVNGLEKYCELRQFAFDDTNTYGNEELAAKLRTKEAAMGVTWSGQLGVIWGGGCEEREDLGFAALSTAWNVTWSFAVNARSKKQELANELLAFLRSKAVDKEAGKCSGAPVRKSTYVDGQLKFPWYGCQLKMIGLAKPLPDLCRAGDKNEVLYEEITNAFAGKKTPKEAMLAARERILKMCMEP